MTEPTAIDPEETWAAEDLFHEEHETDAEPVELSDEELLEALPGLAELIDDELARQAEAAFAPDGGLEG